MSPTKVGQVPPGLRGSDRAGGSQSLNFPARQGLESLAGGTGAADHPGMCVLCRCAAPGLMILASMLPVACSDGPQETSPGAGKRGASSALTPTNNPPEASGPTFQKTLEPDPMPVALELNQLRIGATPRVPYVAALGDGAGPFGRQIVVMPDGRVAATLEVTRRGNEGYRHLSFAPYADGWLTAFDFMGPAATLLTRDGAQRRSVGIGPGDMFSRPGRDEVVFDFVPWDRIGFRRDVAVLGPDGLSRTVGLAVL